MNPNRCRVVLRPRDPLDVFDLGVRFVRERHAPLVRASLVVLGPPWLVGALLCRIFDGAYWIALALLAVSPLLQAPFVVLAGRLLFADHVSVREVLVEVWRRLPSLFAAMILGAVGWGLAALTCFLGTPWVQAGLLFVQETVLLERLPPRRGLARSLEIAGSRMGIALFGAGARWALVIWLALLGELTGQALVGFVLQLGEPFGALSRGDVTPWLLGGLLVAQPAVAVYRLLLYVDVRTRSEGWDLQVALRALGLAR